MEEYRLEAVPFATIKDPTYAVIANGPASPAGAGLVPELI